MEFNVKMKQYQEKSAASQKRFTAGGPPTTESCRSCREVSWTPFAYILIACCVIIVIILTLIWLSTIIGLSVLKQSEEEINERESRSFARTDDQQGDFRDFYENQRACNADKRYLPFPTSQTEEDTIIKDIGSIVKAKCKFVFFGIGFRAVTDVRYQSLAGDTWSSLKEMPEGVLPFYFKKCYEIRFDKAGSLSVKNVDDCAQKRGKRLLFLTASGKENCAREPLKCIEIYQSLPRDDVMTSFNIARVKNPDLLTLVPFDRDNPPQSLQLHKDLLNMPVIVMAVKYKFIYKYGTVVQQYTSNRFTVMDPENNCLGYDISRDKIVTLDCQDKGCLVCSHRAT